MRWLSLGAASLALLLAVAWFYESAAFSSRAGDDAPLYSARRHDAYGSAALVDLLKERGVSVRTLERPSLEPEDHGVLIQVLPTEGYRNYQLPMRQLADWISQGNTVIQFTRGSTELMQNFKILPSTRPALGDQGALEKFEKGGDAPSKAPAVITHARLGDGARPTSDPDTYSNDHHDDLMLWSPAQFAKDQPAGWSPIAYLPTKDHDVVAGQFRHGRGKLVIVGAPTPVLNETMGVDGNLKFVLDWIKTAGTDSVFVDEWSHGIGHEATIMNFLVTVGLLPVLFQLAFLAMLYLWSTSGQRPPDNLSLPRRPSSIEQIETLGFLYGRSFTPDVTFARINTEIQRRIAQALRCQPAQIRERIRNLKPDLRQKLEQLFDRLARRQPSMAIRCMSCGYDLFKNQTGRCPECGALVPAEQRATIAAASPERAATVPPRSARPDAAYVDLLTLSHQIAKEVHRDQRADR